MQGEAGVSVGNDLRWHPEPREKVLEVEKHYSFSCDHHVTRDEDSCPGGSLVNNCEYGIMSICF